ncbi:hypothetical protein CRG98_002974 [Punica granatum]|uniref:Uncharacterized protein n=1 Tax=Punica granatum TaxID=22663 RepID=A0A2I0L7I0_PUNGR|nr:hypothetical protein CRG98_002974 [Punica granatum]
MVFSNEESKGSDCQFSSYSPTVPGQEAHGGVGGLFRPASSAIWMCSGIDELDWRIGLGARLTGKPVDFAGDGLVAWAPVIAEVGLGLILQVNYFESLGHGHLGAEHFSKGGIQERFDLDQVELMEEAELRFLETM